MSKGLIDNQRTMGTMPVFMTAISTILGAILFLRFGYSLAHVGLFYTLAIIVLGHLVTIPTALAVAEIATNQKVEGGGAYYMISRSFGLNIGGAIGIALFLSQAISVAFYVIAFTVSCRGLVQIAALEWGLTISDAMINYGFMALLTLLMLTKGANVGVKALYLVVVVLAISLVFFFMGTGSGKTPGTDWFSTIPQTLVHVYEGKPVTIERFSFFQVFTFIFPAFTGIAAGLGLSGDLKEPRKSIPNGTLWATVVGIIVYVLVALKLYYSASLADLASDELYMENIALWGPIVPIGLACAAISSALGSVMIAPRTLQALGVDKIVPDNNPIGKFFGLMARGKEGTNEPFLASIVTCAIGFIFVSMGDINAVAEIISMFFMLTYGAICTASFLEHMAADPSYRPTFKSRWYISLGGGILCFVLMFKMNFSYALASVVFMFFFYFIISYLNKGNRGIANLYKGIIFQVTRRMQILLQKREDTNNDNEGNWRPFVISISKDTFSQRSGYDMVRWIAHRYGFGTYMHYIQGFLNDDTKKEANEVRSRILSLSKGVNSRVYLDTIISPSYTSAIAQSVQLPGISGKGNNMILFEFSWDDLGNVQEVIDNYSILKAADLDICMLRSTIRGFGYHQNVHIWITETDYENSNLLVLLGYILLGHPEWKDGNISVFSLYSEGHKEEKEESLLRLIKSGRLPISSQNIDLIRVSDGQNPSELINEKSKDADITMIGFNDDDVLEKGVSAFDQYPEIGNILFVSANQELDIE